MSSATAEAPRRIEVVNTETGEVLPEDVPLIANLYAKMAKVLGEVHRIPKSGENTHFRYKYATESDLTDAIRPLLSQNGIAFFATVASHERFQEKGKTTEIVELLVRFCDTDTGATIEARWFGEGEDRGDKALYKAYTGAIKYGLMKTFLVATGDDPEQDGPDEAPEPKAQRRSERAQTKEEPTPERSEEHTQILRWISENGKKLPRGVKCTVGTAETPDLKKFVNEQWAAITTNVGLAKKAARAIKDSLEQPPANDAAGDAKDGKSDLERINARYFALLNEKYPNLKDDDRRIFQEKEIGKKSCKTWEMVDYENAILAVQAGKVDSHILPF